jgi:erythromycin esterase-like protein
MWYLDRLPKGSKVVIWTATVHAAQHQGELPWVPLGARLVEKLGNRVASVGFTALEGQTSMAGMPSKPLAALPSGSLEERSLSGESYAILSREALRAAGAVPSRLFGRAMSADWSRMFDLVVFVRDEVAPTVDRQ